MSAPAAAKPAPPAAKPAPPAPQTDAEPESNEGNCVTKNIGIALAATAVVAAITIPILCAVFCSGEDKEDEKEKDVKLTGNAVLEKLVGWVKDVKGGGRDAQEEEDDGSYEEIASVADFAKTQSL